MRQYVSFMEAGASKLSDGPTSQNDATLKQQQ